MDSLVDTYFQDDESHDEEISKVAFNIQSQNSNLLQLIKLLGPYFTAKETASRVKACTLLGDLLEKLPDAFLSSKDLSCLTEFLCTRLQDHYTLQPSILTSFTKISASINLSTNDAKNAVIALFKEVHVRSSLQVDRYKMFQILANMFDNHRDMILSMGSDFLCNYIQCIDGEQDPRNLLIIFQLSYDIISNGINMGSLEEEFFDVTSCYFPIDFNPASVGKKTTITNQDLVLALRRVISSTEVFAKYWIPLCLEKMESDVESAKLDAILTLIDCLPRYKKRNLEPHLSSIWSTLRQEITHVVSQDVEKNALNLLTQLVESLSLWPDDHNNETMTDLKSFLSEVLSECLSRLEEPIQDKLTWMSGLMLLACAKGSRSACHQITSAVMPLLLNKVKKIQSEEPITPGLLPAGLPTGIYTVIEYMVNIMSVCSSYTFAEKHPLSSEYKEVLCLFVHLLNSKCSNQTKCVVVAGFASLMQLNVLLEEDILQIADCFLNQMMNDLEKKLSNEILSAAGYLASKHPDIAKANVLPDLFKRIPSDSFLSVPLSLVRRTFNALAALSTHFTTLKDVVLFLVSLVEKSNIDEAHSEFLSECLSCLQQITQSSASDHDYVEHLSLHVALPLIKKCIQASLQMLMSDQCCARCNSNDDFFINCISLPVIKSVAVIVRNTCQKQKPGDTTNLFVHLITDLYLNENLSALEIFTSDSNVMFNPFNPNYSLLQSRTVCFITSSLCAFPSSVTISRSKEFMLKLLAITLKSPDQPTYVSAAKAFSGLLNKYNTTCDDILTKVLEQCQDCLTNPVKSNLKLNALTLLVWTTKALVLCSHKKTKDVLCNLLQFLNDDEVGGIAAGGFDIILRDSEEVLNTASHAVVRLMYRQRFFLLVLPELIYGFNAAEMKDMDVDCNQSNLAQLNKQKKANHLTALSHLLLHLPKQVLLQEFPSLLPMLIHSMHSQDPHLLHSVLSAVYFLLQDASELMEGHIDRLLDDFTRLSRFEKDLNVRLKAVQCIGASTLLPATTILPLKNKVIKQLAIVLDDPKRDVRTEAAKARSEWFLAGV